MKRLICRNRKNRRSIILNIILYFFLITGLFVVGFLYLNFTQKQGYVQKYLGNVVTLTPGEGNTETGTISDPECEWLEDLPYVDSVNAIILSEKYLVNAKAIGQDESYEDAKEKMQDIFEREFLGDYKKEYHANCHVIGLTDSATSPYFLNRGYFLVKGKSLTREDAGKKEVLISDELAEQNDLHIGDVITIHTDAMEIASYGTGVEREEEFRIKGIYHYGGGKAKTKGCKYQYENGIFVSGDTLKEVYASEFCHYVQIILKDYLYKEKLISEMTRTFGEQQYEFHTNDQWNKIIQKPIQDMELVSGGIYLVLLIGILVILCILTAYHVRKGKKEIGILLAMGEKKSRLIMEYVIQEMGEVFWGGVLAFLLTVCIIAPVARNMNERQEQELQQEVQEEYTKRQQRYMEYSNVTIFDEYLRPELGNVLIQQKTEYNVPIGEMLVLFVGVVLVLLLALTIQIGILLSGENIKQKFLK